jgi:phage baseplate assembly protein W
MQTHYALPVNFEKLMRKGAAATCDLQESVRQHVFLLLVTRFGENSYDPQYGCELWEYDFEHPAILDGRKNLLIQSIKNVLERQELRLGKINIKITIDTQEFVSRFNPKQPRVKKQVAITVTGVLKETNQVFQPPPFIIHFSPVSIQH